jgi:hypothetical protein
MDQREVHNYCDLPRRWHSIVSNDFDLKDLEGPERIVKEEELPLEEVFPTSVMIAQAFCFNPVG